MIEQQIVRRFLQSSKCLLNSLYATQIFNPFLNSSTSVNHNKDEGFQPIVTSLYPLMFL